MSANRPGAWRRARVAAAWLALLTLFALGGCRQVLYSQLSEQEANEMVAALVGHGLDAGKTVADKHWGVEVAERQIPQAMQVLAREGLPRGRFQSLGDMFKREGIVSTPTEERVRFIHGVSQELSRTLSMIDGVLAARVHIVLPQNDPLADRAKPSSASVFIRHRADADLQGSLIPIKSLVVRSVEGLSHDSVYVTLFAAERAAASNLPAPVTPVALSAPTVPSTTSAPAALSAWFAPTWPGAIPLAALLLLAGLAAGWVARRYLPLPRLDWPSRWRVAASSASASASRSDSSL